MAKSRKIILSHNFNNFFPNILAKLRYCFIFAVKSALINLVWVKLYSTQIIN